MNGTKATGVKKLFGAVLVSLLAQFAYPAYSHAENFRYEDSLGTVHFTNDWDSIPEEYQKSATSIGAEKKKKKALELGLKSSVMKYKDIGKDERLVQVVVNGVKMNFIMDAESTSAVITHKAEEELGLKKIPGSEAVAHTPTGALLPVYMVELAKIQLGQVELKNITAVVKDFDDTSIDAAGIIGMDDLQDYDVVVDKEAKTVTIKPQE